jgi:Cu-Zn family superoxide dismutase
MKRFLITVAIASIALSVHAGGHIENAHADLIDKSGMVIGRADLKQGPHGGLIHVRVTGLTPGKHGLHLHSHGDCLPETGFKSAKGHVGKVKDAHGLMNPKGPEPGDLPNIFIGADGTGEMEAFTSMVSLQGGEHELLDADGSTFVIHTNADDHVTQPIGGAGSRVACGTIQTN